MPKHTDRGRRAKGVAAAVAVLTAVGGGLTAYGLSQQETDEPPPAAVTEGGHTGHGGSSDSESSGSESSGDGEGGHHGMNHGSGSSPSSPSGSAAAYDRPSGETMSRSEPTKVRIPSLDVSSKVIDLGLQSNKRMEVPDNGTDTGWYTGSPTPGELGPAVLAAHVTWEKKPAVYFDLSAMKTGQKIEVDRKDGSTATFEVTSVGQYPKADFPTDKVYGEVDHAAVRLITCGGRFDGETGHHVDNVVVYAKLVDTA